MTQAATQPETGSRIITFYSYKGGTGRTMALANVAWIMASVGKRVLMIDWDLEAPGLHRYFHPFMSDPDMTSSPGLIDFFLEFVTAARTQSDSNDPDWYVPYADLLHYVVPIQWDFGPGALHMVSAGQQGGGYATRVASMDWPSFYDDLGGGVFIQSMKKQLRERYDYIVIDSRTGLSDTSGICAVQMPDDLVCCFTLNLQSIHGAAAVADSAFQQRLKPATGEPGLRVWPVATRVELFERDRLERARAVARRRFGRFLTHLPRSERSYYFGSVEILYQPYFAYEEILAVFADRRQQTGSLLSSFEQIARWITGIKDMQLGEMPEDKRETTKAKFLRRTEGLRVFVLMSVTEKSGGPHPEIQRLLKSLNAYFGEGNVLVRRDVAPLVSKWMDVPISPGTVADAQALVLFDMSPPGWKLDISAIQGELEWAAANGLPLIPALFPTGTIPFLGVANLRVHGAFTLTEERYEKDVQRFCQAIEETAEDPRYIAKFNPEDPNKGRWGGRSERDGIRLSGEVNEVSYGTEWFNISLKVEPTSPTPLEGEVVFYLHPTFEPNTVTVPVRDGTARLDLSAWGAFTVGASAHQGKTFLELDLAQNPSHPEVFRIR